MRPTMRGLLRLLPLLVAGVLALLALPLPGMPDFPLFLRWVGKLEAHGLVDGYRYSVAPYPPFAFVVLAGVAPLAATLGLAPALALKLVILAALALSIAIVWAWTRDVLVAGLLALGLVLNTTALGYIDVLFLPTLLLALWALQRERFALASLLLATTGLIKWQPMVLAPVFAAYALGSAAPRERLRRLATVALPALAVFGLALAVFGQPVLQRLALASQDPYFCGQGFNATWIAAWLLHALRPADFGALQDGISTLITTQDRALLLPPKLVFGLIFLAVCLATWRRARDFRGFLLHALLGYLAFFLFSSGVHENHLFVGQVLAVLLWAHDRRPGTALYWSLASNLNLLLHYGLSGHLIEQVRRVGGFDVGLPLALLNLAAFGLLVVSLRRDALIARPATRTPEDLR